MLKIGLFGAGHLGKIHLQQWNDIKAATVVGFYDSDPATCQEVAQLTGFQAFTDPDSLIKAVDAIDIVTPTTTHYAWAKKGLLAGKHLFIEKPITNSLEEARDLIHLVQEARVKCQIGHVERYNPALLALKNQVIQPMFIEAHRLAQFNPRGTDVSVILDLMIHDIDIVLHLVKSTIKRISASGVSVMSENPDIANARIEFDNGCVANLTSSRISLKKMRKMRLFQRDAYIGVDFLDKKTEIIRLKTEGQAKAGLEFPVDLGNGIQKTIAIDMPIIDQVNAIRLELEEFTNAVLHDQPVRVTVQDGYQALEVAHQVLRKMSLHNETHTS